MLKPKFSKAFKDRLSEKLMDLGNLTFVALVVGQFVDIVHFSIPVVAIGIVFALACYFIS
jgi:hypothetical protein